MGLFKIRPFYCVFFDEYFAFLMFWGLKIRLWKCLRGGRDRISCHGVLLDRTTTLWTENWCRCRPSTTCSQRTSKPFESMTKHLWLINVENTMTWWSCSGTVNNKIINVFDWDRQNFQMNEWYRKYNSYKIKLLSQYVRSYQCWLWRLLNPGNIADIKGSKLNTLVVRTRALNWNT